MYPIRDYLDRPLSSLPELRALGEQCEAAAAMHVGASCSHAHLARAKYGTHPLAPKSFVPHHMQRLSVAAVKGDAKGVRAAANKLKRKVMGNAASAAAVGARA